ncbi:MAG: PCRF domain-containing protein [Planctomycetes bacterium]|nr:PCRF domain-containing protein [Planctomycetota bacterium]
MEQVNQALIAKLEQLNIRYVEIENKISQPDIASTPAKFVPLTKEQGKLRPMVEKYRRLRETLRQAADSKAMAQDTAADPEFQEMARQEASLLTAQADKLLEEIKDTLVMADDPGRRRCD